MATITASLVSSSDSVEKFRQEFNTLRSDVSNIQSGSLTITNEANNRILTSVSTNTFNAEAGLTFDGSTFSVGGAMTVSSLTTLNGNLVIPNAGNIGSAGDTDAIAIASDGTVTFSSDVTLTGASYNAAWDKSDNALEFADNAKAIFGTGSDLQIYHDGSHSAIQEVGTGNLYIQSNGAQILLQPVLGEQGIIVNSNASVGLYYDNALKLGTTSTGIDVTGTVTSDGADLDGAVVINESSADVDFRVESNGNENMLFVDAGNDRVGIGTNAPASLLHIASTGEAKLTIEGDSDNDASEEAVLLSIKSDGGNVGHSIGVEQGTDNDLVIAAGDGTVSGVSAGLSFKTKTTGTTTPVEYMKINSTGLLSTFGGAIFNEDSADVDFRVESNGNANMLFVDGGNDRVGIGTNAPSGILDVRADSNSRTQVTTLGKLVVESGAVGDHLKLAHIGSSLNETSASSYMALGFGTSLGSFTRMGYFGYSSTGGTGWVWENEINGAETLIYTQNSSGNSLSHARFAETEVNFNFNQNDLNFRVESENNANMLFVDAGNDTVHIGSSAVTSQSVPLQVGTGQANQIVVKGSGSGYTQGGIIIEGGTDNTPGGRAQGVYYFNEGNDRTYYSGTLYNNGTVWGVASTTGTSLAVAAADTTNAVLAVDGVNGRVGIGDSSPAAILEITQASNLSESTAHLRISGAGYAAFHWLDGTAYYIGQNGSARSLRLYSSAESAGAELSAGATSFTTFSDERLKENVEPVRNALQSLSNLRTVKYHLKDVDSPEDKKKIGVIAQDLVGVIDEVIDPTFRPNDNTEYMGIRYTELVPVLIKAIQEQQDLIESLTARVAKLEAS